MSTMSGNDCYVKTFPALNKLPNKLEAKTAKRYTSNISQAFTVSVLDKKFDNGKVVNVENAKCVCKKIINETGVDVEIGTTKTKANMTFILSGKQANVSEAKKRIISSIKTQDKQVSFKREPKKTINFDVPVRYRRSLIGINGDTVRDLCNKYKVKIVIPTKEEYNDKITITGAQPKLERVVQDIKELMEMIDEKQLGACEIKLDVPVRYRQSIIGFNGETVRDLCNTYKVQIVIPSKEEYNNIITITGTQPKLKQVTQEIKGLMEEFDKKQSRDREIKLDVPVRYRRSLIGINGDTVRDLCNKYKVKIVIPTKEEYNDKITITGAQPKLERVVQEIKEFKDELDKKELQACEIKDKEVLFKRQLKKSINLDVPIRYRRSLIGINGDTVRDLSNKYKVKIVIPTKEQYNDKIMITGAQPKLERVVQEIKELMEEIDKKQSRAREIKIANESKKKALEENSAVKKTFIGDFHNPSGTSVSTNHENGRMLEKTYTQEFPVIPETNILKIKNDEIGRKRQYVIRTPKTVNQALTISVSDYKLKNGEILNVGNARRICKKIIDPGCVIEISSTKSETDLTFIISGKLADVLEVKKKIMSNIQKQDKDVLFKREQKKTINLDVPVRYRRSLIGINGTTVRDLCNKHKVHIVIPTREEYNDTIKITGTQPKLVQVTQAIKELMEVFDNKKFRPCEKTLKSDFQYLQENPSGTTSVETILPSVQCSSLLL